MKENVEKPKQNGEIIFFHELKSTIIILFYGLHVVFIIYFNSHIIWVRLGVIKFKDEETVGLLIQVISSRSCCK